MEKARRLPLLLVAVLVLPLTLLAQAGGAPTPKSDATLVSPKPKGEGGSDLDAFMQLVLARRDESWKRLQQYVLEEKESFDLTGPGGLPLYGFRREYSWF